MFHEYKHIHRFSRTIKMGKCGNTHTHNLKDDGKKSAMNKKPCSKRWLVQMIVLYFMEWIACHRALHATHILKSTKHLICRLSFFFSPFFFFKYVIFCTWLFLWSNKGNIESCLCSTFISVSCCFHSLLTSIILFLFVHWSDILWSTMWSSGKASHNSQEVRLHTNRKT